MNTGILVVALLLVCLFPAGVVAYRKTLGRGSYSGTTRGAVGIGSLLGIFLGLTAGLTTLLLVLVAKAVR